MPNEMERKAHEILIALGELQAIALRPLRTDQRTIELQGAMLDWTSLDDMQSAYIKQLTRIRDVTNRNRVDYNAIQQSVKFPTDFSNFIIESHKTRTYYCKLVWHGYDRGDVLNDSRNIRVRALWQPKTGQPSNCDVLCLTASQNNLDILRRCLLYLKNHKDLWLAHYKAKHPEIPFDTLTLYKSRWEGGFPTVQPPKQHQKLVDANWYREGESVAYAAETMILIALPYGNNGRYDIHDPVTGGLIEPNSVSASDVVIRATERFYLRLHNLLRTLVRATNMEEAREKAGKAAPPDGTMDDVLARLVQAQLDDSDVEPEGEQKPDKKRRKGEDDD